MDDLVERERVEAQWRRDIADAARDPVLPSIIELAAASFRAPFAFLSLSDAAEAPFAACFGLDPDACQQIPALDLDAAMAGACWSTPDLAEVPHLAAHPLVSGAPHLRFLAAAPLITETGLLVGALCVADITPGRRLTDAERDSLTRLAATAVRAVAQHAAARRGQKAVQIADERKQLLAQAEQMARIGTWFWDVRTNASTLSDEVYLIHGFDPDKPSPALEDVLAGYHPDDLPEVAANVQRALREAKDYEHHARVIRPDGEIRHIVAKGACRVNAEGEVTALYGTFQDVTVLKLADAALRESEARYRMLADRATDIILRYDRNGVIEFASPACQQIGYTPDEMVGSSVLDLLHPDHHQVVKDRIRDLVSGADALATDRPPMLVRHGKGGWRWLEGNPSPIFDEAGEAIGAVTVLRDVTVRVALEDELRRKQAEAAEANAALALSEARYRLMTDKIADVIVRMRLDGSTIYASPAIHKLAGYTPDEVVGMPVMELIYPPDVPVVSNVFRDMAEGAKSTTSQYRMVHKDGHLVWVENRVRLMRDESGQRVEAVAVLRDVSERKAMEEELERRRIDAEAAAKAKAEFLANMSHEIRTPLTGMIGFAGLLQKMEDLPALARTYVDRVATSGETLLSIVNDVLDFSKTEAGQIELDAQPFAPDQVVTDAAELIRTQAEAKGLSVKVELADDLPDAVMADSSRIRQVLLNLLSNALKFTSNGGIVVRCDAPAAEAGLLRFTVTDTGPGIAPERRDRLFQRFSQLDGSITRQYGGTGLSGHLEGPDRVDGRGDRHGQRGRAWLVLLVHRQGAGG